MLRVGITGIDGLIGWHLYTFLHTDDGVTVVGCDRDAFASSKQMDTFVSGVDAIVHLAGMNRGDEREIEETNPRLTQSVIDACLRTESRPHILFASSTHIDGDTAYGRSKRQCTELFRAWANTNDALFTEMVLLHVFGEGGRPFYNSVVSTFCHQLAHGEQPEIIHDGQLELLHAQQLAQHIDAFIRQRKSGTLRLRGRVMSVSGLLRKLEGMAAQYRGHLIPDLDDRLDMDLFNTYRSYLFPGIYPVTLQLRQDERGTLFESVKSLNGGQCFISTTKQGVTRGNHYHRRKFERFLVIQGEALIRVRKLFSDHVETFRVCGSVPQYVDIPTLHAHNITNTGRGALLTLFWSNEIFDPASPETYAEQV